MGVDIPINLLNEEDPNSGDSSANSGSATGSPRAKKSKKSKSNQNNSVNSCFLSDNASLIKNNNKNQKGTKIPESITRHKGRRESFLARKKTDFSNPS